MGTKKTIVIGAGFGGLSVSALLAKKGFDVTVIEKNSNPGGKALLYKEKGFSFDMGPSWYLMLEAFENFFAEFDKTTKDFYKTVRLDPSYRVFFENDDTVDIHADLEKNFALFDTLEENGAQKLKEYLKQSQYQYETALGGFIYRDYRSIRDILNWTILVEGMKLKIFKNLDKLARKYFSSDKARKLVEYSIAFVGGAPHISPAIYSLLTHCDLNLGVWYPIGGIGKIAESIYKLAKNQGVNFQFNQEVTRIDIKEKQAYKVTTNQAEYDTDIVVSSADYHHTETQLLDLGYQTYPPAYWEKRVLAPSAFLIYVGLNKKIKGLLHHNLYFNQDWIGYFKEVFGSSPVWPNNPSYYVCCQTQTEPTLAPPGGESLMILVLTAPGLQDTPQIREKYSIKILTHLDGILGENIQDAIVVKKIFAQNDFSTLYNAYKGTALGLAHTLRQTALLRPTHQSKKAANLYYCGQYTHPGVGIPVTLISSQIVSNRIEGDHGK